jgi:hypothetical protein
MYEPIYTAQNDQYRVEIVPDHTPIDPLTEFTFGTILSAHSHIGDRTDMPREEIENELDALPETAVILPVYKYEHSGIKLNTSGFRSRWDSGQIGYIYADLESDHHAVDDKERLKEVLESEIERYSMFVNGEVYGYMLYESHTCSECDKEHTEQVDSCWGFYGHSIPKQMNEYLPEGTQIGLNSTGLYFK